MLFGGLVFGLIAGGAPQARAGTWSVVCWKPSGLIDRWCEIAMRLDWQRGEQRFIGAVKLRREGAQFRLLLGGDRMIEYGRIAIDTMPPRLCQPDFDCEIAEPVARRVERELRTGQAVHLQVRPAGMPTLDFTLELDGYRAAVARITPPNTPW